MPGLDHKILLLIDETRMDTEKSLSAMPAENPRRSHLVRFVILGTLSAFTLGGCGLAELGGFVMQPDT